MFCSELTNRHTDDSYPVDWSSNLITNQTSAVISWTYLVVVFVPKLNQSDVPFVYQDKTRGAQAFVCWLGPLKGSVSVLATHSNWAYHGSQLRQRVPCTCQNFSTRPTTIKWNVISVFIWQNWSTGVSVGLGQNNVIMWFNVHKLHSSVRLENARMRVSVKREKLSIWTAEWAEPQYKALQSQGEQ